MDDDIHFGDLEETAPERQLRPDQNRHYAVVAYAAPSGDDLPIYVDMDVVREMEVHALSNTDVELGGVLLGGHYVDENGREFVVITDSLRAEHYEATKGSFKFTHETWSDITRKRDAFPAGTQMVGWYHTHPGWGVFLSGMDTFICDHFFNKPLDVALVIDPCQSERAFFQWTSQGTARHTRATSGFYLTASRFRLPELEIFAAQLEGTIAMPSDPRYGGLPGAYPPPVVHIAETRQTWLSIAVLGMLLMQFSVLALIAWRMVAPPDPSATVDSRAAQMKAERELLDRIIGSLDVAPEGVVQSLEEQRQKNEKLRLDSLGLVALVHELEKSQDKLTRDKQSLQNSRKALQKANDDLKAQRAESRKKIADLKDQLKEFEEAEDGEGGSKLWAWMNRWKWYLTAGVLVVLVAAAAWLAAFTSPSGHESEPPSEPVSEPPED